MKKIFTIAALMFVAFFANAQKYMRYHMSDSTFFGFYTESVDSMMHTPSSSAVYMGGNLYEIPLDKVDSITFEGVSVYDENVIGKYRIYEIEADTLSYRKAYIDNRAMLIASRTGEFGANDTIIVASEYYKTKWLIMTNNDGDVEKFFDGKALFFFDYQEEGGFTVLRIADSVCTTLTLKPEECNRPQTRASVSKSMDKFLDNIKAVRDKVKGYAEDHKEDFNKLRDFVVGEGIEEGLDRLIENIDDVNNNPELHNQKLIVSGLEIVGDLGEIGATLLEGIPTGGLAWALLAGKIGDLVNDLLGLSEEMFPDIEQKEIYNEYYRNKYNIVVKAETPENITSSGATLKGSLTTFEEEQGRVYFYIYKYYDSSESRDIDATLIPITNNSWLIEAQISSLEMNTTYMYHVFYERKVDGLTFLFFSDNYETFKTASLCPDHNHPHMIDLGLPSGTKWACCNVGASVPEGYGGYYAWGETDTKSEYTEENYKYYFHDFIGDEWFEYLNIGSNISGTSYDVAHVKWGNGWRMPTLKEAQEICDICSWERDTINGFSGQLVTGPNGNSIFLPAADIVDGTLIENRGFDGYYRTGTLNNNWDSSAELLIFYDFDYEVDISCGGLSRHYGCSVRPVNE